jgi:hypothetical protein
MFKQFLIFLCLLGTQHTLGEENNVFSTGQVYNITWNYTGPVGILVETHLNNSWVVTEEQGCKYLSIVVDSGQQFFLWTIPDSFYKYWKYGNKVSIINLSNNAVLKNTTFNIKNPNLEITDTALTPITEYITTHTLLGENTVTAQTLTTPAEVGDNDKGKVCIKDTCLPTYSIVIMCVVVLIILCLCCCLC